MMAFSLRTFVLISLVTGGIAALSCKDQNNRDVDWFYAYKLPELSHYSEPIVSSGEGFFYLDANDPSQWRLSNTTLASTDTAIGYTLHHLSLCPPGLANTMKIHKAIVFEDVMYMLYNDEHPSGSVSSAHAHAKGVMVFDSEQGLWLVHSVPKFPQTSGYAYASNGMRYGQSFLCLSLPYSQLAGLGKQFLQYWPYLYAWNLPASMRNGNQAMAEVLSGGKNLAPPFNSQLPLKTVGGTKFLHFAKAREWGKDLYFDYVAPTLETPLYTETWQLGRGDLQSNCSNSCGYNSCPYVKTSRTVSLPENVTFTDTHDHSKWGVSAGPSKPYICVGDINRQSGQFHRGGGTVCLLNTAVWNVYYRSVTQVLPCT